MENKSKINLTAEELQELINEQQSEGFNPEGKTKYFVDVVNEIQFNVFTAGVKDDTMVDVDSWEVLFEYWNDFGNLSEWTQEEISLLLNKHNVPQNEINYILNLPEVSVLEK